MACNCAKGGKWKVVYPDGRVAIKNSEAAAKLQQARIPGSKIEKA